MTYLDVQVAVQVCNTCDNRRSGGRVPWLTLWCGRHVSTFVCRVATCGIPWALRLVWEVTPATLKVCTELE